MIDCEEWDEETESLAVDATTERSELLEINLLTSSLCVCSMLRLIRKEDVVYCREVVVNTCKHLILEESLTFSSAHQGT